MPGVTEAPEPTLDTVAKRLAYARRQAGLNQGDAANKIGISRNTVSRHERGEGRVDAWAVRCYAEAYGVPIDWIRLGDRPSRDGPSPTQGTAADEQRPSLPPGRYYVVCPVCGKGGVKPPNLWDHLRSADCLRVHGPTEAARIVPGAQRDPGPWLAAIERRQLEMDAVKRNRKRVPADTRRAYDAALEVLKVMLESLERQGHERYEVPDGEPY